MSNKDLDLDEDEFFIEDISKDKKKKKADGCRKGKRVERSAAKILTARFNKEFSRSVGSGNRWGQVSNMPTHAKETFSGDICCPEGFKWVFESKGGYEDIDLNNIFKDGNKQLDGFLKQAEDESTRSGRKPMLLWKKNRKPWFAFVHTEELKGKDFKYKLIYDKWSMVALDELLKLEDEFFTI